MPRFIRGERRAATAAATNAGDKSSVDETAKPVQNGIAAAAKETTTPDSSAATLATTIGNGTDPNDTICDTTNQSTIHSNGIHQQQPKINGHATMNNHNMNDSNINYNNNNNISTKNSSTEQPERHQSHQTNDENLSHLIRKRIDSETRNLEKLMETSLDKTVTGIVEFKDDLMRADGSLRQRHHHHQNGMDTNVNGSVGVDAFLKREINAAVNQVNVLPAVLSNGHGGD